MESSKTSHPENFERNPTPWLPEDLVTVYSRPGGKGQKGIKEFPGKVQKVIKLPITGKWYVYVEFARRSRDGGIRVRVVSFTWNEEGYAANGSLRIGKKPIEYL